jgi:uncharacterized protein (TIGR02646 family)
MTRLVRVRTVVAVPAGFRGQGRITRSRELVQARIAGPVEFNSSVWKAAKVQLKLESGGKCAYCESPTDTVAHGDVEHFRPKSVYWWLAYCYDNYLYSCQICNQVFKKDHFPVHASAGPWAGPSLAAGMNATAIDALANALTPDGFDLTAGHAEFASATKKELARLVDPYVTDPDPLFKWVANDVLKEVEVRAASNKAAAKRAFAGANEFFGLNREELKRWRWKTYANLVTFKDSLLALEAAGVNAALQQTIRDQIKDMMKVDAPYAGMVRYFVTQFGLAL